MNISVIVCTHNRGQFLEDALRSLAEMKVPSACNIDVVVVDNASTDNTKSVIDKFMISRKFRANSLFEPKLGKSFALNKAVHNSSGDILVFVDDDHIVSKEYLEIIHKAVEEHPLYSIFCGRIHPNWDGSEPQWVHDNCRYPIRPFPIPQFDLGNKILEIKENVTYLPGSGNLIIKKEVFERVGLFSEELGPKGHNLKGGEDIEFVRRALRKGEKILYSPHIMQLHQVFPENLRIQYLVKKAYHRSTAAYQFPHNAQSGNGTSRVPFYLFRQAMTRFLRAALSYNANARRYYLVKFAATLGEINGRRKSSAKII